MGAMILRREFLQLAHPYQANKHSLAGGYASEKLDGQRAFWDGGLSRGIPIRFVPWAAKMIVNSKKPKPWLDKDSTGLWSRSGNPIFASDAWLNNLPCCFLDGELWLGRKKFQAVSKIVKRHIPDETDWETVQYAVFACPSANEFFKDGHIKNPQMDHVILKDDIHAFMSRLNPELTSDLKMLEGDFINELSFLSDALVEDGPAFLVPQTKLSTDETMAQRQADELMARLVAAGAEGVIVRDPKSVWTPKRMHHIVKVKPCKDDEATITGFTSGRETDKGSKLLGMIGALITDYKGKRLELSGLTNEERQFESNGQSDHASRFPGQDMPNGFEGKHFKTGDMVTFKYRELSDDGIPKEARYFRPREDV